MSDVRESLYKVIRTVASPLRFFAVALITLAILILVLATKSNLPAELTANLIYVAFAALMILLIVVSILVVFFPKKLTFDQEAHLTVLREKLGDNELHISYAPGAFPGVEPKPALENRKES